MVIMRRFFQQDKQRGLASSLEGGGLDNSLEVCFVRASYEGVTSIMDRHG